jgi:hypothetical protein
MRQVIDSIFLGREQLIAEAKNEQSTVWIHLKPASDPYSLGMMIFTNEDNLREIGRAINAWIAEQSREENVVEGEQVSACSETVEAAIGAELSPAGS